jgi:hypothetical protein
MSACCAALCMALGLPVHAEDVYRTRRTTTVNQEVLVQTHQHHTRDCRSATVPRFTLTQPPEHGRVDVREGAVTARPNAVGIVDCTGMAMHGILVYYIPADGYVGGDTFHYELRIETYPPLLHEVTVNVKQTPAASDASSAPEAGAPPPRGAASGP